MKLNLQNFAINPMLKIEDCDGFLADGEIYLFDTSCDGVVYFSDDGPRFLKGECLTWQDVLSLVDCDKVTPIENVEVTMRKV